MKKLNILCFIILLIFGSCSYTPVQELALPEPDVVSFTNDILPIFNNCTSCHPSSGGLDLKDDVYNNIMDGRVDIDNPEQSLIYTVPLNHYASYSASEASLVLKWITQGAINDEN